MEMKMTKARSAIVVVAPDWLGRIFVLEAWADRCSTDRLIERMYEVEARWKLRVFGGEANGLQELFQEAVQRDARLRGKRLPLKPIHVSTRVQKPWRIRTILQKLILDGKLFLQPDMTELRTEIGNHPLTPVCDLVDALSSAVKLIPPTVTVAEATSPRKDMLDYLRKSGAPPFVIEEYARTGRLESSRDRW
jgi:hypothetical protein